MRNLLLLFFIYFYVHLSMGETTEEMLEKVKHIHDICVERTGVAEELIDDVNDDKVFADDMKLKCYMKCTMEELGYMNGGEVNVEAAVNLLPDDIKDAIEPTIRLCDTQRGADPCDNAWLTQKCYAEHNIEEYRML